MSAAPMNAPSCTIAETPFGEEYCALHGHRWPCPEDDR